MDGAQQDQRGTNTMSDYYKYIFLSTIKSSNNVFYRDVQVH